MMMNLLLTKFYNKLTKDPRDVWEYKYNIMRYNI